MYSIGKIILGIVPHLVTVFVFFCWVGCVILGFAVFSMIQKAYAPGKAVVIVGRSSNMNRYQKEGMIRWGATKCIDNI
jgi:hypothetical protein